MKNDKKAAIKAERMSSQYKKVLADKLMQVLYEDGLSKIQMRRVFSYAYQSLRGKSR